jgi:hypothetical protein
MTYDQAVEWCKQATLESQIEAGCPNMEAQGPTIHEMWDAVSAWFTAGYVWLADSVSVLLNTPLW